MKLVFWYIIMAACSISAWGDTVLQEDFSTTLQHWTLLNTPSAGGTVTVGLSEGALAVTLTNNARFRYQGVQSVERYALPAGGTLVIDYYGINGDEGHSHPFWAVSANAATGGYFDTYNTGWFAIKGRDAYFGDWVQWNGIPGGYVALPTSNSTQLKHVITVITADFIKVYIEDDYFENLFNPAVLYSTATSDVFTTAQLEEGLYVEVLAARYTEWFTGQCLELFDGVKVSRFGIIPIDCQEAVSLGYGMAEDINQDCKVDLQDLAALAQVWLDCVNPQDAACDQV